MNRSEYRTPSTRLRSRSPDWTVLITLLLIAFVTKLQARNFNENGWSYITESKFYRTDSIPCLEDRTIQAIVDSALLYEAIKPIVRDLKLINNLQNRENEALRNQIRLQNIAAEAERKERQAALKHAKTESFWKGFTWGGGTVGMAAFITSLLISTL